MRLLSRATPLPARHTAGARLGIIGASPPREWPIGHCPPTGEAEECYSDGGSLSAQSRLAGVKRALISDIHGNLEALKAVLEDIGQQGIQEIYCLGDIVGYGPNPRECIDLVMENCRLTLLGNHDQ